MERFLNILVIGGGVTVLWWWLSRTYDLADRNSYWQVVRARDLRNLLLAQFVTGASLGFLVDLVRGGTSPRWVVILVALSFGAISAAYVWAARFPRTRFAARFALILLFFAVVGVSRPEGTLLSGSYSIPGIQFDALATFLSITVGTRLFRAHSRHEGTHRMRLEVELSLAHELQRILAPPVAFRNDWLEVYGRSVPSDRVGGDLVDMVVFADRTLVYLVDVSGHGIRAGALMGSVKTAVHMSSDAAMPQMLQTINRILPSVKEPHMYATFAGLTFRENSDTVQYAFAGHSPILHYCASAHLIVSLQDQQFPIGLFTAATYASQTAICGPGDLFVLFSDGITEIVDRNDQEFGLRRLENIILANAGNSLEAIQAAILAGTAAHGIITDDRSVLLVRVGKAPVQIAA